MGWIDIHRMCPWVLFFGAIMENAEAFPFIGASTKIPNRVVVKGEVLRDLHGEIVPAKHTKIKAATTVDRELRRVEELERLGVIAVATQDTDIFGGQSRGGRIGQISRERLRRESRLMMIIIMMTSMVVPHGGLVVVHVEPQDLVDVFVLRLALLAREVLAVPLDGVGEPGQDLVVVLGLGAVVGEFLEHFARPVEGFVHFELGLCLGEHGESDY